MKTYNQLRNEEREIRIERVVQHKDLTKKQQDTITSYLDHMRAVGRSIETIAAYAARLSLFGRFVKKPFEKVTKEDFTKYLAHLQKKDHAVSYINGFKVPLGVFYQWLLSIKKEDPLLADLKPNRKVKIKTRSDALEKDEIKKLIESAETFRDKFIISCLYETAMRKSEFCQLRIGDIKVTDSHAVILSVSGKTGYRKMPLPLIMSYSDLINHLESHPHKDNPNAPLIYTMYNATTVNPTKAMGLYGLNDLFRKYQHKAGLKKKVHPHILRHSRLTHLADEGWNEMDLRVFAGWRPSSNMAERYVHTSGQRILNSILKKAGLKNGDEQEQEKRDKSLDPKNCPRCKYINSPTNNFCKQCGMVLELKVAVKITEDMKAEDEIKESDYRTRLEQMQQQINILLEEYPGAK